MTIHGLSKTPLYQVWLSLRDRCKNPKNRRYGDYGGRGIFVCREWDSFVQFYSDMGDRPSKDYSIDRINNNSGYYKENCRWATRSQQQLNKRKPKTYNLPKGKDHWTNKNRKKAVRVAQQNIKKAHGSLENNPNSKMTFESSRQMKRFYSLFHYITFTDLGLIFGVGRETARKVIKGILWV